jgi:UDP-N-acetylmuramoylalanine--D-glutamate ligase
MSLPVLDQQPVLVLGHGISGLAMARWCSRQGARVTLADTRDQPERMAQLRAELPGADVCASLLDAALLARQPWALVCKSPGLSPAQLQAVTAWAAEHAVPVVGELDLFAQALREVYADAGFAPQLLAITGTNGKTTTTSLTGQLLARAGLRVAVAGNIGPALLDVLAQASPLPHVWVLELSSFQLDGVRTGPEGFEPTAATVLNITQDHLDWHGDMAHYTAAKFKVFGSQALWVLNREDAAVMAAQPAEPTTPKRSRTADPTPTVPTPAWTTFGTDLPRRPGDWGLETVNGMAWLVRALPADETRQKKRGAQPDEDLVLQRLMPAEALRIRGRHNAANALAALALATAAGATLAPMLHGLREYRGEPHRVASVAVIDGVEYFDDSKGTNVGATLAAINGLGAERRLVVILGGDGKGQDFSPLADAVRAHVHAVVLIGRDALRLREALADTGVPLIDAATLPDAVQVASQQAREGQAVLLSPACASLDMFKHYAHRAEVFCDAVQAIATERGLA